MTAGAAKIPASPAIFRAAGSQLLPPFTSPPRMFIPITTSAIPCRTLCRFGEQLKLLPPPPGTCIAGIGEARMAVRHYVRLSMWQHDRTAPATQQGLYFPDSHAFLKDDFDVSHRVVPRGGAPDDDDPC